MSSFLYLPPYTRWDLFGTVTGAAVDTDHEADWLVDAREKWPLRQTSANGSPITIANTAGTVNIVAITHHLLDAGTVITYSGDISASITIPNYPRNGVPLNKAALITPVAGVDSVTLTTTGNASDDWLVGESFIGEYLILDPAPRIADTRFGERQYVAERSNPLSGVPPYSERARSRPLAGSQYYPTATRDLILAWYDSQDANPYPLPSLIIPDSADLTDVRVVLLGEPTYQKVGPEGSDVEWLVDLTFTELPRTRW